MRHGACKSLWTYAAVLAVSGGFPMHPSRWFLLLAATLASAPVAVAHADLTSDPPQLLALRYRVVPAPAPATVSLHALAYQPRRTDPHTSYYHHPRTIGSTELYGGYFELNSSSTGSFHSGLRMGVKPDPHIRIGMALEWSYDSQSSSVILGSTPGPGGTTITNAVPLNSSSASLVPWLGFIEFSPIPASIVSPYAGIGGGYEWLHLAADRVDAPYPFHGDYGGWGWEAWGGVAFKLSRAASIFGEGYGNFGTVSRDAYDEVSGLPVNERVNVDGKGVRGGFSFNF